MIETTAEQVYIPIAHIEVKREDMKKVDKLKAGSRVKVLIKGTLTSMAERKASGESESRLGDLTIEVKEMLVDKSADADISDLFDDENF